MSAALKPLLLCLLHFRKGTNSSLARRHWLEQGAGKRHLGVLEICWGFFSCCYFLICFVLPDLAVLVSPVLILTDLIFGSFGKAPF